MSSHMQINSVSGQKNYSNINNTNQATKEKINMDSALLNPTPDTFEVLNDKEQYTKDKNEKIAAIIGMTTAIIASGILIASKLKKGKGIDDAKKTANTILNKTSDIQKTVDKNLVKKTPVAKVTEATKTAEAIEVTKITEAAFKKLNAPKPTEVMLNKIGLTPETALKQMTSAPKAQKNTEITEAAFKKLNAPKPTVVMLNKIGLTPETALREIISAPKAPKSTEITEAVFKKLDAPKAIDNKLIKIEDAQKAQKTTTKTLNKIICTPKVENNIFDSVNEIKKTASNILVKANNIPKTAKTILSEANESKKKAQSIVKDVLSVFNKKKNTGIAKITVEDDGVKVLNEYKEDGITLIRKSVIDKNNILTIDDHIEKIQIMQNKNNERNILLSEGYEIAKGKNSKRATKGFHFENGKLARYVEDCEITADGNTSIGKRIDFKNDKIIRHQENYLGFPDGSYKIAKKFDFKNDKLIRHQEGYEKLSDGRFKIAKNFDFKDDKLIRHQEGYEKLSNDNFKVFKGFDFKSNELSRHVEDLEGSRNGKVKVAKQYITYDIQA